MSQKKAREARQASRTPKKPEEARKITLRFEKPMYDALLQFQQHASEIVTGGISLVKMIEKSVQMTIQAAYNRTGRCVYCLQNLPPEAGGINPQVADDSATVRTNEVPNEVEGNSAGDSTEARVGSDAPAPALENQEASAAEGV